MGDLPRVTRVYRNHHLDSRRWEVFQPRDGDIIVTTSMKAGTTWTQQILSSLLRPDCDPHDVHLISPWVEADFMERTPEAVAAKLDTLASPRFIKSHLPLDGLPYYPQVRYLVVARDPRDVFMSMLNHYDNYGDAAYQAVNAQLWGGEPFPRYDGDPRGLFRKWISRGWFPWESEGWPFWSNMHHTATYWAYRHLPNILLLHYNDMLADLETAVRRIVDFTGIDVGEAEIERAVAVTTFSRVKQVADKRTAEQGEDPFFRGGSSAFFFKGTNGRWRGLLTAEDLELYEQAKTRVLEPDCARWLEQGGSCQ